MESHFGRPDPRQARASLNELDADGARLADHFVTPRWYHAMLGVVVAMFIYAPMLPTAWSVVVVALGVAVIPAVVGVHRRKYGVSVSEPAGADSRRLLFFTVAGFIGLFVGSMILSVTGASWVWGMPLALIGFVGTVVLGGRYDDALRREIAA